MFSNSVGAGISVYDLFILDIETVPQYPQYEHMPEQWKILWKTKISKIVPESMTPEEMYLQRAGILAEFGKVICISTGYFIENDKKELTLKMKSVYGHDEKSLLQSFLQITERLYKHNKNFIFTGHNIREFDIPYLCRRMLINNIQLPFYMHLHGAKPWEVRMIDTLQLWKFGDYKNYISLDLLANVLNVPTSKTDIDGSMVQKVYYEENGLPRIVEYCQRDVVVVANIILRFKCIPLLSDDCINIVI